MAGPLIPYISLPEIPLPFIGDHPVNILGHMVGPITIKPFGMLVAIGVYLGITLTTRFARQRNIHPEAMSRFLFWVTAIGFSSGHILDTIFYHPKLVLEDPWSLLRLWDGLSSFGGFTGAIFGAFVFKYYFKVKHVLPFADLMGAAFPAAWVFGRSGCSVVHDHPGMRSEMWFAVRYPLGGRFDLGLYEMWFAVIVAIVVLIVVRKPRPPGFFLGLTMLIYAPVRFALDFLRAQSADMSGADPRYLHLTPAQWACSGMVLLGFYLLYTAAASGSAGNDAFEDASKDLDPRLTARPGAAAETH